MLDLGVYVIQLAQWCFGGRAPTAITATGTLNADGCDTSMQAELRYADGGQARIETSALRECRNEAVIRGSRGTVRVPDFWCPTRVVAADGTEKSWAPLPEGRHEFNFKNSAGLSFEADEVRRRIQAGELQSPSVSHAESVQIARIEDEIRRQIGVRYAADEV